jgi:hypothetical protein
LTSSQKATGAARAKASLKRQPVPQPLLSKEPKLSSTVRKPKLNGARQSSRVTKRSNVSNAPAAAVTATAAAPSSQGDDAAVLRDSASGNVVLPAKDNSLQPVKKRSSRLKTAAVDTAVGTLVSTDAAVAVTAAAAAETSTAITATAGVATAVVAPVCPYPGHEHVKWHCKSCGVQHCLTSRKALAPFNKKHGFKVSNLFLHYLSRFTAASHIIYHLSRRSEVSLNANWLHQHAVTCHEMQCAALLSADITPCTTYAELYCCLQQIVSILGDGDCFYASVRAAVASKMADSAPLVKTMREWVADTIDGGHLSFYQMQAAAHPHEQWLHFVRQPIEPTTVTVDFAVVAADTSKPRKKRRKKGDASDGSTTIGTEQQALATAVAAANSREPRTGDDSATDNTQQATATTIAAVKSTKRGSKLAESLTSTAAESTAVGRVDRRRRSSRSSVTAAVNTAAADITTTATTVTTTATSTAEQMVDIVQTAAAAPVNDSMQLNASAVTDVKLTVATPASSNKQLAVSLSEQSDVPSISTTTAGATTPPTAKLAAAAAAAAGEAFAVADSSTAAAVTVVAAGSTDAVDVTASSEKPVTPMTLSASAPPSTSRKRKCTVNSDGSAKKYSEDTTAIVDALGAVVGHASSTAMIPGDTANDSVSTGPLVTTVEELKDYIKR